MPFSVKDLRYHLDDYYGALYHYLQIRAQRFLGPLAYDSIEVDQVIEHVIEHLTRLHVLGGGSAAPQTALDQLSNAQFYAYLNRIVKNKAIDRLRRRRVPTSTLAELERIGEEDEISLMNDITSSFWGNTPFATPEETALEVASREEMRYLLKRCIEELRAAPRQLQAVLLELEELGADELIQQIRTDLGSVASETPLVHVSQHKDHAHKKLRLCLQKNSRNLAVVVALRLSEYKDISPGGESLIHLKTLAQDDLSEREVQTGLKHLAAEGLLDWQGEGVVCITSTQRKRLARFYEEGEQA